MTLYDFMLHIDHRSWPGVSRGVASRPAVCGTFHSATSNRCSPRILAELDVQYLLNDPTLIVLQCLQSLLGGHYWSEALSETIADHCWIARSSWSDKGSIKDEVG